MLQIILIIMGIVYFLRRPKIASLAAADMPGVTPETLESWKMQELKSIDWFLIATWGVSVIGSIMAVAVAAVDQSSGVLVLLITLAGFLAGLTVSAVYGSRAAKLKKLMMKQTGFRLP
jgi:hypothetical protein